jgi:hypothetical protein
MAIASSTATPPRWLLCFYAALSLVLLACAAAFLISSWHWPLVGDAPLMHYIVFLMQHGFAPYRTILDLNQPGTYAVEAAVMAVLGKGALAWRIFDLLLLALIAFAMAVICRPHGRFPALFAAVTFALIHARDGLIQLGQRDLLMAALLASAYALLFTLLRSPRPRRYSLSISAGLCLGAAASIKPDSLLLAPLLLPFIAYTLYRQHRPFRLHLALACTGVLLPLLASLLFLLHRHALYAFLALMFQLAPYHASLWRLPSSILLLGSVSSVTLPLFSLWLAVFLIQQRWRRTEDQLLLLGFLIGIFSFFVQGRGYPYHRYPSQVFLLLLTAIAFADALRPSTEHHPPRPATYAVKTCAIAGLAFGSLILVPRSLQAVLHFSWRTDTFDHALTADLTTLGTPVFGIPALNGNVQCLDMAGGCIATLYRLQLVQSTGFLYDCYLYPARPPATPYLPERDRYRSAFQQALLIHPPRFFIVTSDECGPPDLLYRKLARWPWLNTWLAANYRLAQEWRPTVTQSWGGRPILPYGFRIYQRTTPAEADKAATPQ